MKIPNGQALDTVTKAHKLGVTYYDTAPWSALSSQFTPALRRYAPPY